MSNSSKVIVGGCGGARKANNGMNDIPSRSRQVVQSLKEVVNSPETEIYAMLKECNIDPNEAVHRILSQDPFHEVKSRKEKKKETRDMPDSRPRGANNIYNRGGRGGSDRYAGRSASTHLSSTGINTISWIHRVYISLIIGFMLMCFSCSDSGNYQGKSTNKKESGTQGYTSSMNSQAPRLL
ncbi:hypothetical protein Bca4012_020370 [Brassica carinata]